MPRIHRESFLPQWQRLFAISFVWCFYAFVMAWVQVVAYSNSSHPMSWSESLFEEFTFSAISAALSPGVIVLAQRFPLQRQHLARNAVTHIAGTMAYSAASRLLWEGCAAALGHSQGAFTFHRLFRSVGWGVSDSAPLYWLIVAVHHASDYHRRYQNSLLRTADLNAQLAQAQLQRLKMQLHPHFLFNALHAISELIHEDPVAAEHMIVGLSRLLRLSIDTSSDLEVSLRTELEFTQLYLDIEKMRFGDRLDAVIDVEADVLDAHVPNLILQPLVENAIKHGISNRPGKGQVVLTAKKSGNRLLLTIVDNGTGFQATNAPLHEGVGLSTTRERLLKLYGTHHSFHFVNRPNTGAEVVIRIPLEAGVGEAEE